MKVINLPTRYSDRCRSITLLETIDAQRGYEDNFYYRKIGSAINLSGAIEEPKIITNFGTPIIFLSAVSIFLFFYPSNTMKSVNYSNSLSY